jgi:hypothetical protein
MRRRIESTAWPMPDGSTQRTSLVSEPSERGWPPGRGRGSTLLGTSLFDPGPAGTVTFRHQRYPEFLAAAYLVDRRASENQVTDLVGARKTGVVPASMIPVVAWLAALAPDSIRNIVVDNAYALAAAAAAVELPDGRARAVVVGGLLDAAARNEAEPDWSIAPSTLVHNGLEAQLADRLST